MTKRIVRSLALALVLYIPLAGEPIERYIGIDNVCAWPNLTVLPNGDITAAIFNRPTHGRMDGDVEVWTSPDGRLWSHTGTATTHKPGTNRMNVAAGLANNGDLIVLASGWRGEDNWKRAVEVMPVMVSRSSDGGRTWSRSFDVSLPKGISYLIPFGDVIPMGGKRLAAPAYHEARDWSSPERPAKRVGTSYLIFSNDDGMTWGDAVVIAPNDYNETAVLRLRANRWLAAVRTYGDGHLDLYVSDNEGETWKKNGPVTLPSHHPAHLLLLRDGRVIITYGIRERGHYGVGYRISEDEGKTWKSPGRIVELETSTDGGYPATVQLPDASLVTAYYSNGIPEHQRYHMGVARWSLPE